MNDLLALAVAAHGGLERWNSFSRVRSALSIDGGIWHAKHVPGILLDKTFDVGLREQNLTITPFGGDGNHLLYTPERVSIVAEDGSEVGGRDDPEGAYADQTPTSPWDEFHAAFFSGEALWTYFNLPFLYTYPGVEVEEVPPWHEDGETWRSLQATFPADITTHTRIQTTRFGQDGLMRRHDYTVDILGGATGANYSFDYADFQGIRMPTKRRVYAYDDQMRKVPEPLLVSIEFKTIDFA